MGNFEHKIGVGKAGGLGFILREKKVFAGKENRESSRSETHAMYYDTSREGTVPNLSEVYDSKGNYVP